MEKHRKKPEPHIANSVVPGAKSPNWNGIWQFRPEFRRILQPRLATSKPDTSVGESLLNYELSQLMYFPFSLHFWTGIVVPDQSAMYHL
jgi:hypothetical protein